MTDPLLKDPENLVTTSPQQRYRHQANHSFLAYLAFALFTGAAMNYGSTEFKPWFATYIDLVAQFIPTIDILGAVKPEGSALRGWAAIIWTLAPIPAVLDWLASPPKGLERAEDRWHGKRSLSILAKDVLIHLTAFAVIFWLLPHSLDTVRGRLSFEQDAQ